MASPHTYELRPASADEFDAFTSVVENAFGQAPDDDQRELERSLLEFDRTLTIADGKDLVASTAVYSFEMTVPGGSLPTAGVTWVAVLPSHRRRGILNALMRRQLDDIHKAGTEPVAALWASESAIYGRFGYGLAAPTISMTVPRAANALHPVPGTADLRLRLVDGAESVPLTVPVYDHERALRPGMVALPGQAWEQATVFDPPSQRGGASPLRTAIVEDDSRVRGFARYVTRSKWDDGGPNGTTEVRQLHAVDAAARWVLLRHVTDLDLSGETVIRLRPVDDPLWTLLVNPRASRARLSDGLYVRLVDVGAALSRRTYARPVDVVVEVEDAFCPWNSRKWRIAGDATGGECAPTDHAPNVRLTARELGAAYLGTTSLVALREAGLVEEVTPGGVTELAQALHHEPAAWNSFVF
jgi:predicted acetyltransferase